MAETAALAFGRYIRTLRERCGHSLDDVETLSKTFADPINKGYLSRCENGRQKVAFSKMIALSRVYEVDPEVLVERMELDLELDRVGGPETEGLSFEELQEKGRAAANRGALWDAYGFRRDATTKTLSSKLKKGLLDYSEQAFWAITSFATGAGTLGRYKLALHELRHLASVGGFECRLGPMLDERLAFVLGELGERDKARHHADLAIRNAEEHRLTEWLGYIYGRRAILARDDDDLVLAADYQKKAFQAFRNIGRRVDCAKTLLNLADVFFEQKRLKAARRALAACERIAAPMNQKRTRALARVLLGLIEDEEGNPTKAATHWRHALEAGKRLNDNVLRFQAEFFLFRQARRSGDHETAMSLERRLRRISAWVPDQLSELADFRQLTTNRKAPPQKQVS